MLSCGVYEVFRGWCLRTTVSETCCFIWSVLKLAQIGKYRVFSGPYFPEIGLNTERYEVFSPNDTDQKNTDQKKAGTWKLFTQCFVL